MLLFLSWFPEGDPNSKTLYIAPEIQAFVAFLKQCSLISTHKDKKWYNWLISVPKCALVLILGHSRVDLQIASLKMVVCLFSILFSHQELLPTHEQDLHHTCVYFLCMFLTEVIVQQDWNCM